MDFVSVRVITGDMKRLVLFYEQLTGRTATWFTDDFAELAMAANTLAIASTRTMALFGMEAARSGSNYSAILEFLVDDVDQKYEELQPMIRDLVQAPTTMPWGNRSLMFRDPDGNLVNLFTPVTPQARKKFRLSLHRELRRQATEPPDDEAVFPVARKAAKILEELEPKPEAEDAARPRRAAVPAEGGAVEEGLAPGPSTVDDEVTAYERRVAETIVHPSARPVLAIRDDKVTTEFLGPDSEVWAERIDGARTVIDAEIAVELAGNPERTRDKFDARKQPGVTRPGSPAHLETPVTPSRQIERGGAAPCVSPCYVSGTHDDEGGQQDHASTTGVGRVSPDGR